MPKKTRQLSVQGKSSFGSNMRIIAERIGKDDKFFLLDLSPGMLAAARAKLRKRKIEAEFALGNGACLPYEDAMFDDEGLAPGKEKPWFGRRLLKMNALFANKPPRVGARHACPVQSYFTGAVPLLKWIWRGTVYTMDFKNASA
ncbi:class I SAM-dependent methyltransferase [Dehalococcoidia bacterium]|nr:class I SAM-dependent methyltransferase [Dehalococcoidia bacterium]